MSSSCRFRPLKKPDLKTTGTICRFFAAQGLFADCPQDETQRLAFFEQGSYFLPPDEEEEADRRARSPLGDAKWLPTVVEPLAGANLDKATDVQMLRMLYLRIQYTVDG